MSKAICLCCLLCASLLHRCPRPFAHFRWSWQRFCIDAPGHLLRLVDDDDDDDDDEDGNEDDDDDCDYDYDDDYYYYYDYYYYFFFYFYFYYYYHAY